MTKEITNQCQSLEKVFIQINDVLDDKIFCNDDKEILFLSYFDLNMEHIKSIYTLIEMELTGSAFALVRTFYETFFRALWVRAYATEEIVEEINNGNFRFKGMDTILKELDSYYTGDKFFQNMKKGIWTTMSDYTHSGICQLSRRWTGDQQKPNYHEDEILEVLIETRNTLIQFTYTLLVMHNFEGEAILELLENRGNIVEKI